MRKKIYFFFLALISIFPAIIIVSFSLEAAKAAGEFFGPRLDNVVSLFQAENSKNFSYEYAASAIAPLAAAEENQNILKQEETYLSTPREITLIFVGDIMLGRNVEKSIKEKGGDFSFLFENAEFLKTADFAFGNLEGPISDKGKDLRNLYSFRFEPKTAEAMKIAGFDALSLANNHTGDWGKEAFADTVYNLKIQDILPVGGGLNEEEASSPRIIEIDGLRMGLLGFSDVGPNWLMAGKNDPGILIVDDYFEEKIKQASEKVDILIISFHFGEEYQENPNKRQENLARSAIDNGAKIVVGHHPHVTQGTEIYGNGFIAYSLGNFVFDQNFSEDTLTGAALEVKLSKTGEVKSAELKNVKINQYFQPELEN